MVCSRLGRRQRIRGENKRCNTTSTMRTHSMPECNTEPLCDAAHSTHAACKMQHMTLSMRHVPRWQRLLGDTSAYTLLLLSQHAAEHYTVRPRTAAWQHANGQRPFTTARRCARAVLCAYGSAGLGSSGIGCEDIMPTRHMAFCRCGTWHATVRGEAHHDEIDSWGKGWAGRSTGSDTTRLRRG
jgi:hypothetical protein